MFSTTFEATALGILAACETIARSLWPEPFEERTSCSSEAADQDEDPEASLDEMSIW